MIRTDWKMIYTVDMSFRGNMGVGSAFYLSFTVTLSVIFIQWLLWIYRLIKKDWGRLFVRIEVRGLFGWLFPKFKPNWLWNLSQFARLWIRDCFSIIQCRCPNFRLFWIIIRLAVDTFTPRTRHSTICWRFCAIPVSCQHPALNRQPSSRWTVEALHQRTQQISTVVQTGLKIGALSNSLIKRRVRRSFSLPFSHLPEIDENEYKRI